MKLKEYGSELIEIADDGSGVSKANLEGLALRHHTSKFSTIDDLQVCVNCVSQRSGRFTGATDGFNSPFADLQTLASFGFRGEALNSLCAVSELMVTTRTAGDVVGSRVTYNSSGQISSQMSIARAKGTTVALRELFKPLPVRRKVAPPSTQLFPISASLQAATPVTA